MIELDRRRNNEITTINVMIKLYCQKRHPQDQTLCDNCLDLLDYSSKRIVSCHFGAEKPVCGICSIHCFKSEYREHIRDVMKFSGPRMLFLHPFLTLYYLQRKIKSQKKINGLK